MKNTTQNEKKGKLNDMFHETLFEIIIIEHKPIRNQSARREERISVISFNKGHVKNVKFISQVQNTLCSHLQESWL